VFQPGKFRLKLKVVLSIQTNTVVLLTEHQAVEAYWKSGGIAPRILDLFAR
jgi:hypothetical protein